MVVVRYQEEEPVRTVSHGGRSLAGGGASESRYAGELPHCRAQLDAHLVSSKLRVTLLVLVPISLYHEAFKLLPKFWSRYIAKHLSYCLSSSFVISLSS